LRDSAESPLPPANTEAEMALLGAILVNNATYGRVADRLYEEHFSNALLGRIYAATGRLIETGAPANPITLKHLFDRDPALIDAGGAGYLARLAESAVTVINAPFYADAILDTYRRRMLIGLGQKIVTKAYATDVDDPVDRQIENISSELDKLIVGTNRKRVVSLAEAAQQNLDAVQDAFRKPDGLAGVSSGIPSLDKIVGGFVDGDLIIFGGRPGSGKSSLMNSVTWAALLSGTPVHIFSGEMKAPQLAARLMAALTGISAGRQRRGNLSAADWDALVQAKQTIDTWPCFIDDGPLTLGRIRQQARMMKRRQRTGLVFIDHLQLIRIGTGDDEGGRNFETGRISNALKAAAMDIDVPIIALSQLSRGLEQRDDKRPRIADLRESGNLEQDADTAVLLYRAEMYLKDAEPVPRERESDVDFQDRWSRWKNVLEDSRGRAELIVAKCRHDETGVAHVIFNGARSYFHELLTENTLL
jgi:replicative DNA helicase